MPRKLSGHTRRILSNPPQQADTHGVPMSTRNTLEIFVASDDTTTHAELVLDHTIVATGIARRRPGEKRNPHLGYAIALARMFRDASNQYAMSAHTMMSPPKKRRSDVFAGTSFAEALQNLIGDDVAEAVFEEDSGQGGLL
jgi:hypothetical protein